MPGDGVVVPADLAADLARLAEYGTEWLKRQSGGLAVRRGMLDLLAELSTIPSDGVSRTVVPVRFTPGLGSNWLSARDASEATGYSAPWLRELARGGHVIARKFGDRWQYDAGSIAGYRKDRCA